MKWKVVARVTMFDWSDKIISMNRNPKLSDGIKKVELVKQVFPVCAVTIHIRSEIAQFATISQWQSDTQKWHWIIIAVNANQNTTEWVITSFNRSEGTEPFKHLTQNNNVLLTESYKTLWGQQEMSVRRQVLIKQTSLKIMMMKTS